MNFAVNIRECLGNELLCFVLSLYQTAILWKTKTHKKVIYLLHQKKTFAISPSSLSPL